MSVLDHVTIFLGGVDCCLGCCSALAGKNDCSSTMLRSVWFLCTSEEVSTV